MLELIRLLHLTQEFGEQLNPFVRDKYRELWQAARPRFALDWRAAWQTDSEETETCRKVEEALAEGLRLETKEGREYLVTDDPELAARWGLNDR